MVLFTVEKVNSWHANDGAFSGINQGVHTKNINSYSE